MCDLFTFFDCPHQQYDLGPLQTCRASSAAAAPYGPSAQLIVTVSRILGSVVRLNGAYHARTSWVWQVGRSAMKGPKEPPQTLAGPMKGQLRVVPSCERTPGRDLSRIKECSECVPCSSMSFSPTVFWVAPIQPSGPHSSMVITSQKLVVPGHHFMRGVVDSLTSLRAELVASQKPGEARVNLPRLELKLLQE